MALKDTGNSLFDRFYSMYPRKVAKGAALKAFEKINPDEEMVNEMILAIQAQKKYRRDASTAGEHVPDWKHPATWLNGMCWDDEIGSHAELKQAQQLSTCCVDGCEINVLGPQYRHCADHYYETLRDDWRFDRLREHCRQLGITKSTSKDECIKKMREKLEEFNRRQRMYAEA